MDELNHCLGRIARNHYQLSANTELAIHRREMTASFLSLTKEFLIKTVAPRIFTSLGVQQVYIL